MSLVSKTIGLLGGLYNLYALGGTNGGVIVRQRSGTAGTHEVQVYHDGTNGYAVAKSGSLYLQLGATANDAVFVSSSGTLQGGNNTRGVQWQSATNGGANAATFRTSSDTQYGWNSTTNLVNGAIDTGLSRAAAAVVKTTDGSTGAGWIQNTAGTARVTSNVTNATTTFSNLSDLSVTLIAGRKYVGQLTVFATNSVIAEGIKFDFAGGAATATSFIACVVPLAVNAGTWGNLTGTALSTAYGTTFPSGSTYVCIIPFSIVCNAGGTFIPRFAENSTGGGGTATVYAGSYLTLQDSPN